MPLFAACRSGRAGRARFTRLCARWLPVAEGLEALDGPLAPASIVALGKVKQRAVWKNAGVEMRRALRVLALDDRGTGQ